MVIRPVLQPPPRRTRWTWSAAAIVALAAIVFMGPAVRNQFLRWDDDQTLWANPDLNPPTWHSVARYWTHEHMNLWVPVTYTVWAVLAWLSHATALLPVAPLNPVIFHAASIVIHAMTALVIFLLLRRLAVGDVPAAIGAALFALHPVQVEAVAWASGLKDVLCGLMSWTAVWLYVAGVQVADEQPNRRSRRAAHLAVGSAAFVIGMLSKPTAVVVPALAMAVDVIALRRPLRRSVAWLWPWFVLAIPCVIWTKLAQPATADSPNVAVHLRMFVAADALAFYLVKIVWPARLTVDYGRAPSAVIDNYWFACTWILPVCAAIAVGLTARRIRLLAAGAAIVLIGVAPVLGLVSFDFQQYSTVADHYLYVSMAGVALVAAEIARRVGPRRAAAVAVPVLLLLGALCWNQTRYWQNTITLFTHNAEINPQSFAAQNNLATAYLDRREPLLAEQHARSAIRIRPDRARSYVTLGAALAARNMIEEAAEAYRQALQREPDDPRAHTNLGGLLAQMGKPQEAYQHLSRALELDPQDAQAHLNLGTLLASMDPPRAIRHLSLAVRLSPRDVLARTNLGFILLSQGQPAAAAEQFTVALQIDPGFAPAQQGLAAAGARK